MNYFKLYSYCHDFTKHQVLLRNYNQITLIRLELKKNVKLSQIIMMMSHD